MKNVKNATKKNPSKPYTFASSAPARVTPSDKARHVLVDAEVRVLDEASLTKVRDLTSARFGGLVFRRVLRVDPASRASQVKHTYHSPESKRVLPEAEANSMEWDHFFSRVTTKYSGAYTFSTAACGAVPAHDKFEGEPIFGSSYGRSDIDPVSLKFVPARGAYAPRASHRTAPDQDDPCSLVVGEVVRDRKTGKLHYSKWALAPMQLIWAVLLTLDTEAEPPVRQGQAKAGPAARAFWMGGSRLRVNTYRATLFSEKHSTANLFEVEVEKEKHFRVSPFALGEYCHILNAWVLMARYGEVPSPGNIPTTVPPPVPKDSVKAAGVYSPKPMKHWDLPWLFFEGKKMKLDRYLTQTLGLVWQKQTRGVPVNKASLLPDTFVEVSCEEDLGMSGSKVLVPSRPSSPVNTQEFENLSQDSGDDAAGAASSQEVQVFAWGDLAEEEEEMDFDLPVEKSFSLWKAVPDAMKSLAAMVTAAV